MATVWGSAEASHPKVVGPGTSPPGSSMVGNATLGEVCRWAASRWRTPILVTENGYADKDDLRRAAFIRATLWGLQAAIHEGADVRGYFDWSLLDNFEWMFGYDQQFGLIELDRSTQEGKLKASAQAPRQHVPACRQELSAFGLTNSMII